MIYLWTRNTTLGSAARRNQLTVALPSVNDRKRPVFIRRARTSDVAINWGCSQRYVPEHALNKHVRNAIRKQTAFQLLRQHDLPVPNWSTNYRDVNGSKYMGRADGKYGGAGITVYKANEEPTGSHDFYVQFLPKRYEFRVHVWGNDILTTQFKLFPRGTHHEIRSYDNGARFSTKPLTEYLSEADADLALTIAVASIQALSLNFGAVDMILTQRTQSEDSGVKVLEVNTAPALSAETGTLNAYMEKILCLYR